VGSVSNEFPRGLNRSKTSSDRCAWSEPDPKSEGTLWWEDSGSELFRRFSNVSTDRQRTETGYAIAALRFLTSVRFKAWFWGGPKDQKRPGPRRGHAPGTLPITLLGAIARLHPDGDSMRAAQYAADHPEKTIKQLAQEIHAFRRREKK
jgi:hypothetical protein